MIYDKESVRAFILSYESRPIDEPPVEQDIDDFFSLDPYNTSPETKDNIESNIFYNELESVIDNIATDREFYIFHMLAHGAKYEEIGRIMCVSGERIRQIFNELLDKLP
ncbi:sigma-70 family RNA polymerase sigma factor [Staphylococcus condimenti]|uniref:sigma-70 family RNA polymerase sigma factor n=1 Tax=Staphylococcus condimenti TaxID=70255 RepID=UPI0010239A40|nr:sigma-70 family RNA polymerase sigma factor [Staphylococcus condimenti]RZI00538.1 sigma-70 family RNA polymerase sigma factor [Staphylococcus condimenti]